jgi:tetratricopeptide (TPR) repeat protein
MRFIVRLALFCVLCGGCATLDAEREIRRLEARVVQTPDDAESLRDLGVLYLRMSRFPEANDRLQAAYRRDDTDPETLFHLGLVQEKLGRTDTAFRLYERYAVVPEDSEYRQRMEGRYRYLERIRLREEIRTLAADLERAVAEPAVTPNPSVVAVYPLTYEGENARYAPLSRGLSEMLTTDLANVESLRLVERIRLQTLLDEMALPDQIAMDPETTPRVGRLIGAGQVIGGLFDVSSDRNLTVEISVMAVEDASEQGTERSADALENVFALEKRLVFGLIEEMGIELTPEEEQRIEFIPTQNLQAFLAYSRGLLEEDAGNFSQAARFYQRAGRLDPGFDEAAARSETMEAVEAGAGTTDELLSDVFALPPPVDVGIERLTKLNESIGAVIYPGQESREPAQELPSDLPDPPRPPGSL